MVPVATAAPAATAVPAAPVEKVAPAVTPPEPAPASPGPDAELASKPDSVPIQKVMPKKDNAVPNDHHIANFKKMNRIASRPSVANDKKASAGSFVAYKPASNR